LRRLFAWQHSGHGVACRRASGTHPESLGPLTVSMLRGAQGRQRQELDKLVDWLQNEIKPDIVHLSNVLLVGMARQLIRRLNVPVVCLLAGEDSFLERILQPHYDQARAVMRERVADPTALVALNHYCADHMADYLSAPRKRIHVIPPGLNLTGHGTPPREPRSTEPGDRPYTIGYLARICPDKGLHLLAAALERMVRLPKFALRCGQQAQEAIRQHYSAERMARQTIELYKTLLARKE